MNFAFLVLRTISDLQVFIGTKLLKILQANFCVTLKNKIKLSVLRYQEVQ